MIRDILAFLVLVLISALVWFGGIELEWSEKLRIGIIAGIAALYLIVWIVQKILAIRRSMRIEKQLKAQAEQQIKKSNVGVDGLKDLQSHFKKSLQTVKRSRLGRAALVELPWYVFIGPPGAGKTSALQESGINLSVMGSGVRGVRGIGGTKNCDWWFTEEAIFLDTAGRYSVEVDDHEEWGSFLSLVNKARKKRAINGCILAISVKDLMNYDPAQAEMQAQVMRERLDELCAHLKVVFPVYVVISKCDLLDGFNEFFHSADESIRDQILGVTLPWQDSADHSIAEPLREGFEDVYRSVNALRPAMLEATVSEQDKAKVYEFPMEFEQVQKNVHSFISTLFQNNHLQDAAALRGVYFTSSVQDLAQVMAPATAPVTSGPQNASSFAPAQTQAPTYGNSAPAPAASKAPAASTSGLSLPGISMAGMPGAGAAPASPPPAGVAPSSGNAPTAPGVTTNDVFSDLDDTDAVPPSMTPEQIATQALTLTQSVTKRQSNRYRQSGMFLKGLFGGRIIGDKALAHPLAKTIRRRGSLNKLFYNGSIVAAVVACIWLGVSFWGNRAIILEGARARTDLVTKVRSTDVTENEILISLSKMVTILEEIDSFKRNGTPWHLMGLYNDSKKLSSSLRGEYFNYINKFVIFKVTDYLENTLEKLRQEEKADVRAYDNIFELYRTYLTLTGKYKRPSDVQDEWNTNASVVRDKLETEGFWYINSGYPDVTYRDKDPETTIGRAMKIHLEFFLSQLDRSEEWKTKADASLTDRITFELSEALWIQQSYRDIIQIAESMYENINKDLLVSGPNAELLLLPNTLSSVFTQEKWTDYVKGAIEYKAASLVEKYKILGINKTKEELTDRLSKQFQNDYRRHWWRLSSQVRPVPFIDIEDAIEKMDELTGDESPYVSLTKNLNIRKELKLEGGFDGSLFGDENNEKEPWLEAGLNAMYAAKEALDAYSKKTQVGKRIESKEALIEVAASLNDAYTALSEALKAIPDDNRRLLANRVLSRVLDNARIALSSEIGMEVNEGWKANVLAYWQADMSDLYPFNPDAELSVPLNRFAELFNAQDGLISKQLAAIKDIKDIEINGKSIVYESREFKNIKRSVALIQKVLFQEASKTVNSKFYVRFVQRSGVSSMSFEAGDQLVSLYDKQLPRYELKWLQNQEQKARFTVHILKGIERKSWYKQSVDDPWCILRLFSSGEQVGRTASGGIKLHWPFQAMAAGKKFDYNADLVLEAEGWDDFLDSDFWYGIQLPQKVTR